jgi:hypothetical protein
VSSIASTARIPRAAAPPAAPVSGCRSRFPLSPLMAACWSCTPLRARARPSGSRWSRSQVARTLRERHLRGKARRVVTPMRRWGH